MSQGVEVDFAQVFSVRKEAQQVPSFANPIRPSDDPGICFKYFFVCSSSSPFGGNDPI